MKKYENYSSNYKIIAEYIPAFIDFGENIKRIYGQIRNGKKIHVINTDQVVHSMQELVPIAIRYV